MKQMGSGLELSVSEEEERAAVQGVQKQGGRVYYTVEVAKDKLDKAIETVKQKASLGYDGIYLVIKDISLADETNISAFKKAIISESFDTDLIVKLTAGVSQNFAQDLGVKIVFDYGTNASGDITQLNMEKLLEPGKQPMEKISDAFDDAKEIILPMQLFLGELKLYRKGEVMPPFGDTQRRNFVFLELLSKKMKEFIPRTPEELAGKAYLDGFRITDCLDETTAKGLMELANKVKDAQKPELLIEQALQVFEKNDKIKKMFLSIAESMKAGEKKDVDRQVEILRFNNLVLGVAHKYVADKYRLKPEDYKTEGKWRNSYRMCLELVLQAEIVGLYNAVVNSKENVGFKYLNIPENYNEDQIAGAINPLLSKVINGKNVPPASITELLRILEVYGRQEKSIARDGIKGATRQLNSVIYESFTSAA